MVRFGAAADEDDTLGRRIKQSRDGGARLLDFLSRHATPAVNRGRVAATSEHRGHRRHRFGPQRGGRVPVEISLGSSQGARARPSDLAHYVPVAVALPKVSEWTRPLLPSTRRSQTSASETELR